MWETKRKAKVTLAARLISNAICWTLWETARKVPSRFIAYHIQKFAEKERGNGDGG